MKLQLKAEGSWPAVVSSFFVEGFFVQHHTRLRVIVLKPGVSETEYFKYYMKEVVLPKLARQERISAQLGKPWKKGEPVPRFLRSLILARQD